MFGRQVRNCIKFIEKTGNKFFCILCNPMSSAKPKNRKNNDEPLPRFRAHASHITTAAPLCLFYRHGICQNGEDCLWTHHFPIAYREPPSYYTRNKSPHLRRDSQKSEVQYYSSNVQDGPISKEAEPRMSDIQKASECITTEKIDLDAYLGVALQYTSQACPSFVSVLGLECVPAQIESSIDVPVSETVLEKKNVTEISKCSYKPLSAEAPEFIPVRSKVPENPLKSFKDSLKISFQNIPSVEDNVSVFKIQALTKLTTETPEFIPAHSIFPENPLKYIEDSHKNSSQNIHSVEGHCSIFNKQALTKLAKTQLYKDLNNMLQNTSSNRTQAAQYMTGTTKLTEKRNFVSGKITVPKFNTMNKSKTEKNYISSWEEPVYKSLFPKSPNSNFSVKNKKLFSKETLLTEALQYVVKNPPKPQSMQTFSKTTTLQNDVKCLPTTLPVTLNINSERPTLKDALESVVKNTSMYVEMEPRNNEKLVDKTLILSQPLNILHENTKMNECLESACNETFSLFHNDYKLPRHFLTNNSEFSAKSSLTKTSELESQIVETKAGKFIIKTSSPEKIKHMLPEEKMVSEDKTSFPEKLALQEDNMLFGAATHTTTISSQENTVHTIPKKEMVLQEKTTLPGEFVGLQENNILKERGESQRKASSAETSDQNQQSFAEVLKNSLPEDQPLKDICPNFAVFFECPFDEGHRCPFVHGDRCDFCKMACLHPRDDNLKRKHLEQCEAGELRDAEQSFLVQISQDKVCWICRKIVWKRKDGDRKFGILEKCNHVFCVACIRNWRKTGKISSDLSSPSGGPTRLCPRCKTPSGFYVASEYWQEGTGKTALLQEYKSALAKTDCMHFRFGRGRCPFGGKCFYRHVTPDGRKVELPSPSVHRWRTGQDGGSSVIGSMYLWDFIETRSGLNVKPSKGLYTLYD